MIHGRSQRLLSPRWTWLTIALALVLVAAIASIHARQRRVLGASIEALETVRRARIDLAKGFLHASLGDGGGAFDRSLGIALLAQATDDLDEAMRQIEPSDLEHARAFGERLQAFRADVTAWRDAPVPSRTQETELRIAFHDLERRAARIDTEVSAHLAGLATRLDRLFGFTLAVGLVLLVGVLGVLVAASRTQAEAQRALVLGESRLRALLDHLPGRVWLKDAHSRYATANRAYAEAVGRSVEQLAGCEDRDLWPPDQAAGFVADDERVMSSRRPIVVEERVGQGSQARWFETVKAPVLGVDDAVLGTVGFARDVTERRRQDEERKRAEAQHAEMQRLDAIGRLAGGVAHDFNNLLTVILSCAEALEAELSQDRSSSVENVREIREAGHRAAELTRQLLAYARKQVISPVPLDLGAVVRDSEKLLRRVLGEHIELVVRTAPDLWLARCDPGQLNQVVLNLAVNARDAMPGGGTLSIEARNVTVLPDDAVPSGPSGGEFVRLSVRDTGVGIPDHVKAHLFEPFFTTKPVGRGTGLGLATTYGIVQQCDGAIRVDSTPGKGSSFELFFPRTLELPTTPSAERGAGTTTGEERVLVVEDDARVREVTARILTTAGYDVEVAADPHHALELAPARLRRFRLLVTDVVMPGIDGRSLAEELRRRHPALRVLYVSGYGHDVLAQRGVVDGIEFLAKPFTGAALLARVRAVLDKAESG